MRHRLRGFPENRGSTWKGRADSLLYHAFDPGAAWTNVALQAIKLGWHTHAMVGFDMKHLRTELRVHQDFRIGAAISIDRLETKTLLPQALQTREVPNLRKPVSEITFEGEF